MKRKLTVLTTSSTRCYAECPQKFYIRYELGYLPLGENAAALTLGTRWHRVMDAYWANLDGDAFEAAFQVLNELVDPKDSPYEFVYLHAMLLGYHARWGSERYEVVGQETEFCVPIRNPETGRASQRFVLAGATDKLVRREDGAVIYVDHKTSGEDLGGDSKYWKKLVLDPQASNYGLALRELGLDIVDCIYDVAGKPRHKPLKATPIESRKYTKTGALYANQRADDEAPGEYFERLVQEISSNPEKFYQRGGVPRTEDQLHQAALDLWGIALAIGEARNTNFWPRRPSSCFQQYGECAYWGVCTGTERLEDPSRFQKVDHVHVELSPEICRVNDTDIAANAAQSGQKEAS